MNTKQISSTLLFSTMACSAAMVENVNIVNPLPFPRKETVAVKCGILPSSGKSFVAIDQEKGDTLQTQLTHDGFILIPVTIDASGKKSYRITEGTAPGAYPKAFAAIYPQRDDDLSWENDLVGFRAYGPAKESKGERLYGYDLWLKRGTDRLTVPTLYADDINPDNWAKTDSLRRIDNALAEEFIKTFSYHVDHGYGMDCYAVGPTLGACTAALTDTPGGNIVYPWGYKRAEILDNGPLRVTMRLTYPDRAVGDDIVSETRLIMLDAGERLNRTEVTFTGATDAHDIVTGIVLHDNGDTILDSDMIAYSDPTQGKDNGRILIGAVCPGGFDATEIIEQDGFRQLVGRTRHTAEMPYVYYWGFAWDRTDIRDMSTWETYLKDFMLRLSSPLVVNTD